MFSFFKKKPPAASPDPEPAPAAAPAAEEGAAAGGVGGFLSGLFGRKPATTAVDAPALDPAPVPPSPPVQAPVAVPPAALAAPEPVQPVPPPVVPAPGPVPLTSPVAAPRPVVQEVPVPTPVTMPVPESVSIPIPAAPAVRPAAPTPLPAPASVPVPVKAPVQPPLSPPAVAAPVWPPTPAAPVPATVPALAETPAADPPAERQGWLDRLRGGLRKTGVSITQVFVGARIDDALYEELEEALLLADTGVKATEFLLKDLKRRVKEAKVTDPAGVKTLLADALTELLQPLERALVVGKETPTVIMVAGVNGAGKTTSIGKLTRYLADHDQKVLLAAADTFRAAAREQLAVWAQRSQLPADAPSASPVEIVSQAGGDPSAVSFDAVAAGKARGCDVVIADTAGRLPTQLHLMDELKKIQRTIGKAQAGAPHEVLLVIDGNTGQNALSQVKAFDEALGLTGLVVTKLDGTAKGGVLAAIALWSRERAGARGGLAIPVYFIGVGEKLEDLQTFSAREFSKALLD